MEIGKKYGNNQSNNESKNETITNVTLKDMYKFGCFSKERYPWFTVDSGEQPKKVQTRVSDISVTDNLPYLFEVNDEVIKGTSSTGIVLFKKIGETDGYYVGLSSKKKFNWSCPEVTEYVTKQNKFITDFLAKNTNYTGETPSNYLINRTWKPVDVSTLDRSGLFKPGDRVIYQAMGIINDRINQYPHIEEALKSAGFTFQEPPMTTPEYDEGIDISVIMGGKYRKFFDELKKQGDSTTVWPLPGIIDKTKKNTELKGNTTGVTPNLTKDPKELLNLANKGGIPRKDCRQYIKSLYKYSKTNKPINDDQLLVLKRFVYACYRQNTKFVSGGFGVGDELTKLSSNTSKYGIADFIRGTGQMNESINIKNIISENLIKISKEKHTKLLSENTIITNRFKILSETSKPKNKKELRKFFDIIITESAYLHSQDFNKELIKESFFDLLQGIFGNASTSVFQYFKEHITKWFLQKFVPGVPANSWLGNLIITSVGNIPVTELHNLTNCSFVTKLLSKSMAEASINKIKNDQGLTAPGYDLLRNALVEVAEDSAFGQKIEHKISEFICPKLQGLKDNLDKSGLNMKSKALGLDNIKSTASKIGDKVTSLVTK